MPGRVEFLVEALEDLEQGLDWYAERSPRAASALIAVVEKATKIISAGPSVWPRFELDTRRYVFEKFPYSLIYRDAGGVVQVIAVAHDKRKPGYWHHRVGAG